MRQAEVTAAKMIERTAERLEVTPSRLVADTGYGSAEMLAWLVDERGVEPHIPVFDKSDSDARSASSRHRAAIAINCVRQVGSSTVLANAKHSVARSR